MEFYPFPSFKKRERLQSREIRVALPGGFSGGVTPDPIPNSEVKSSSADDTAIRGKVGRRQGFLFLSSSH